ncbi:MAG: hypothetical protein V7L21_10940 [Nostoc sp.]|uniref:hypothetical protein n=1 Tax=unclassified Nostoc TaxID=2593658 RepID=UPI0025FB3B3D|nr:hypothetical protein [Nostoc sp. NMS9]MBN3940063.1 hypothetical protein [Nostoc sp. NMS9]
MPKRLFEKWLAVIFLSQQPCEGTCIINVPADPRRKRMPREALLIVRCGRVEIQRPDKLSVFGYPPSVTLFAVEALEVQPPAGQEPIHWRLLTTHKKLHPQGDGVFGHGELGMGHKLPMPNPQCPKRRGDCPSPPTRGWSFPPLSINKAAAAFTM